MVLGIDKKIERECRLKLIFQIQENSTQNARENLRFFEEMVKTFGRFLLEFTEFK